MTSYSKPLLMIGIPTVGAHSWMFTNSLLGSILPSNFSMQLKFVPGLEVGRARNILMQEAVNLGAKYLMMRDEDTIAPANLAPALIYHLENHPDWSFVGGLYATKAYPPEPLIYMEWGMGPYWNWLKGEIVGPIKFTGMGASMIRVSDVANLPADTYQDRSPWDGSVMEVHEWFYTGNVQTSTAGGVEKLSHTEDAFFFRKLEEAGLKSFVDTGLMCGHYDKTTNTFFYPPLDGQVARVPDAWNHEPRTINLGAGGEYDPYELQVDLRKAPHIDFVADIRALPAEWENAFDVAKSHHVLEHFGFQETPAVLAEWYRIIKPGGILQVTLPDIQCASEAIAAGRFDTYLRGVLYGDQGHPFWSQGAYGGYDTEDADGQPRKEPRFLPHSYQHNHHKSGFTAAYLIELMEAAGFVNVVVERHTDWCELRAQGQKPVIDTVAAAVEPVSPADSAAVPTPEAAA